MIITDSPRDPGVDDPHPGSARWWLDRRIARRARRTDASISVERIVAAALRIVDGDGAESLTMRRIALELDVTVASLYNHVAGRDDVLVLLADEILGVLDAEPPAGLGWRAAMEWLALRFVEHLDAHPHLRPIVSTPAVYGPRSLAARERALRILVPAGFDAVSAADVYATLATFVVGAVGGPEHVESVEESAARVELFADSSSFPLLSENAEEIGRPALGETVLTGVRLLLDGVEKRFL